MDMIFEDKTLIELREMARGAVQEYAKRTSGADAPDNGVVLATVSTGDDGDLDAAVTASMSGEQMIAAMASMLNMFPEGDRPAAILEVMRYSSFSEEVTSQ